MMRGREGKGPPSTDLLVCFPSRAHLSLMPKPICSPARPSDSSSSSSFHHRRRRSHHQQLRHSGNRGGGGHGSPLMWAAAKTKLHNNNYNNNNNSDISEPSSPKVTCAGQIKVRSSKQASSCKNWQSVMEEIERMHNKKKRPGWMEALGFKKEVMQFLTCLRNISFDFRCFGSIPAVEISSDDDEEEEEEDDDEDEDRNHRRKSGGGGGGETGSSGAVFSKWFMILQEENLSKEVKSVIRPRPDERAAEAEVVPPPNALLLMRCRSAPAKSWLEEREEEERERRESEEEVKKKKEEEEEANYCEFAVEIGKENWIQERISRSRSWKR